MGLIGALKNLTFNPQDVVKRVNKGNLFSRVFIFLIGVLLTALAFNICFAPQNLVTPGVSGLAILVAHVSNLSAASFIFYANLFLIGLSLILLGGQKSIIGIIGSLTYSVFVFFTQDINSLLNISFENDLLYVLCGAVLYGLGTGLVLRVGFSTGGTDILGLIISKYTHKPIGKSLLIANGMVILLGAFTFGYTMILYSIIIVYLSTLLVDKIVLGISDSKMFLIDTEKDEEITRFIMEIMQSGVTIFKAKGGYKNDKKEMLMCVVSTTNYFKLKESIKQIDPNAFIMVSDCYEVHGGTKKKVIPF